MRTTAIIAVLGIGALRAGCPEDPVADDDSGDDDAADDDSGDDDSDP